MSNPPEFRMSNNYNCLAEGYTERMAKLPTHPFELEHDPFHPVGVKREFAKVTAGGRVYWADVITGALYDIKSGRGQTGNARLKL